MSDGVRPQRRIYLVRHGEVENPRHVVYADLPGFGLSDLGRAQAVAAAEHLSSTPVDVVVSSPLERALATAVEIAAPHDLKVETDQRLTEWRVGRRWAGIVWEDLPAERPGELEAYLTTPDRLSYAPESLADLATRVLAAMRDWAELDEAAVFVSHQDPVQAARRIATGGSFERFHENKPGHGSVITLEAEGAAGRVREAQYWQPDQGREFPPVTGSR